MMKGERWAATIALSTLLCATGASAGPEQRRYHEIAESEAAFASAVSAHRRGDLEAALRGYRASIRSDEAFVEAMVNLARLHVQRSEFKEATRWLAQAERHRPGYSGIRATRGLLALNSGNLPMAIDELSQARHRTPRDVEVLTNLAAALITSGASQEAIPILEEVQHLSPYQPTASFNLGLAYDRMGDTTRAAHFYQRFLGLTEGHDPQRATVAKRMADLTRTQPGKKPGGAEIRLHSSSPATVTRTVAQGGRQR